MAQAAVAEPPDFSSFPPNTVTPFERAVCLACVSGVFTRVLGLTARKAAQEMKSYTPTVQELTSHTPVRPYFLPAGPKAHCPYCDSSNRRLARILAYRIEGGRATDRPRRELVKALMDTKGSFTVLEERHSHDEAFFSWLERMASLRPDQEGWIPAVTEAFLERKLPKENWREVFEQVHTIRRSIRLEGGWEIDNRRLFLAAPLYYEAMAVQYILSRSRMSGGLTFEGRLTLPELVRKLRLSGYLRLCGIEAHSPADILEELTHHLAGGDGGVKMYYLVDRRDFLNKLKALPMGAKPKRAAAGA